MNDVGKKVKELRQEHNMTLKELSEKIDLSTGYLSQFERGLTSIAIEYLEDFAKIFHVPIHYFFNAPEVAKSDEMVIRSYDQKVLRVTNKSIYKSLSYYSSDKVMLPKIIEMLPMQELHEDEENLALYPHQGEEFLYVLEGILTVFVGEEEYTLYPGDSIHYLSTIPHNWINRTNNMVKMIGVHSPSDFDESLTKNSY